MAVDMEEPAVSYCPNCMKTHRQFDAYCALAGLGGVLVERGYDDAVVGRMLEGLDLDAFWEKFVGPAVDRLEDLVLEHQLNTEPT